MLGAAAAWGCVAICWFMGHFLLAFAQVLRQERFSCSQVCRRRSWLLSGKGGMDGLGLYKDILDFLHRDGFASLLMNTIIYRGREMVLTFSMTCNGYLSYMFPF